MKKNGMNTKTRRTIFLVTALIWTAAAVLHLCWMIRRWDVYGAERTMELRGLILVLSIACAALNFVNYFRWKNK